MKPYMIFDGEAMARPVPRGWALKPAGSWGGREATVAYDPRRHDVAVLPDRPDDDTYVTQDLRHCGWQPQVVGHAVWQTRVNRRVILEGSWHECAHEALGAVAYAHDRESLSGSTRTDGARALLKFGAQATEGEPVSARAYGLSVSVRPKGARTLWVRDRMEVARAALDRTARLDDGPHLDAPGL